MKTAELHELSKATWSEFGQAVDAGQVDRAIMAIGSLEQHGPHLPLSTDTIIADHLASQIASRCKTAILLPSIEFGCSSEHVSFPGTMSIGSDTLSNILLEITASLMQNRLKRFFIINGHGGNRGTIEVALTKIKQALPEMQVYSFTVIDVVKPKFNQIRRSGRGMLGHADELETSMMLAIDPSLVDMSKAVRESPSLPTSLSFESEDMARTSFAWNAKELSKSGIIGDPEMASADSGMVLLNYAVEVICSIINEP